MEKKKKNRDALQDRQGEKKRRHGAGHREMEKERKKKNQKSDRLQG